MKLLLASASPRRAQLLSTLGFEFAVCNADIDETPLIDEQPVAMTLRLAIAKAQAIYDQQTTPCVVLGGDTTVFLQEQIMGKPADKKQAMAMLSALSGCTHEVASAVAVIGPNGIQSDCAVAKVTFHLLSADTIADYCASDEPYDKAGAYGIQGAAIQFVSDLQGSYSGVMGLPLWHTHRLLQQALMQSTHGDDVPQ